MRISSADKKIGIVVDMGKVLKEFQNRARQGEGRAADPNLLEFFIGSVSICLLGDK
jgi:hypothetical protein